MAPVSDTFHPPRTGALAIAVSLTLLLAACGGGKHKAASTTTTRPKVLAVATSVLKIGSVDIESAGPTKQIDTATGKAVLGAAQAYLDDAVFTPLKTGALGSGYAALFDTGVKQPATGPDRRALTDLDVGKVTNLSTVATPVHLSSLEGTLGELMYLATDFDITVKATSGTGPVSLHRHIELTFAKTGAKWLVTAYRVQSVRTSTAGTTTTTATRGTTP